MKKDTSPTVEGRPAVVIVTWEDACLRMDSSPISQVREVGKLSTRHTVGYLVHKDKERVVLAVTFDPSERAEDEHHVDDLYTIPAKWIRKIEAITKEEK